MFYTAYRHRGFARPGDIKSGFRTFKQADDYAYSLLCDDDDSAVYSLVNGVWYKVIRHLEDNKYLVLRYGAHYTEKEVIEIV